MTEIAFVTGASHALLIPDRRDTKVSKDLETHKEGK